MTRTFALFIVCLAILAAPMASAEDTPRGLWLKVKCALCHGDDGASQTPTGRKTKAPDLRTPEIQELSNSQLEKLVEEGHEKMPAFRIKLTKAQVRTLVIYIRDLAEQKDN